MNPEIFREYDVRGVVGRDLDEALVEGLGRAIGTYAQERGVRTMTVGRDCRLSSEAYQESLLRGLLHTGIRATAIGMVATPMLYFSIRHLRADGGVMITGSHNPPDFNGFKICIGPDTIFGNDIQNLRRLMERGDYASGRGTRDERDISAAYLDHLFHSVAIHPSLRIVVDGGNGVGGLFAVPLFRRYGCAVTDIFCEPDGRFPNHFPDPTVPANLETLISAVADTGAQVGLAYDGDADRLGVVTGQGRILWGDELLLLFSRAILARNPGAAVIGEVKCSQRLFDDIAARGGRPIMWKAGHSLIKGKMKEEQALLAGEMSGHLFFADRYFGYDDALYASARLLEILSETGKGLDELLADVPPSFTTPEIRIDCPDRIKFQVVEEVKARFRATHPIVDIDGVRITFADGWGLLRPSNTQPVLVLRFEASTEDNLRNNRETVERVMRDVLNRHGAEDPGAA